MYLYLSLSGQELSEITTPAMCYWAKTLPPKCLVVSDDLPGREDLLRKDSYTMSTNALQASTVTADSLGNSD